MIDVVTSQNGCNIRGSGRSTPKKQAIARVLENNPSRARRLTSGQPTIVLSQAAEAQMRPSGYKDEHLLRNNEQQAPS
jgi:hypothetical protein